MEQIYTIPVNEAFDKVNEHPECGCPVCVLYRKLQSDELDIILGASMMEPDIRIKTNESGFCLTHYNMMMKRRRMLGIGLMMESHLDEVKKKLNGPVVFGNKRTAALNALDKLNCDCYVCGRIDKNLSAMIATTVYLWETDMAFRDKFKAQPYFCLPHYHAMVDYASKKMHKHYYPEFYDVANKIQNDYLDTLRNDVSWFCKKFDYRYDEEPWYNSRDSLKRSIAFLSGAPGEEENK